MPVSADEVVDLLQQLIRNRCVNDGSPLSGGESRSADLLEDHLHGPGIEVLRLGELDGRDSVVARIEGSDSSAPTLLLMGHTDVVPANAAGWQRDPFGGELVDGFVWGRGAVDMLNLTASMAVAVRRLARSGWRPRGTLVYLGVADEEAGGAHGAGWLLDHAADAVRADYVVTESGGIPVQTPTGRRLLVTVGEKGVCWTRLIVRGTPGHGSRPYGTDNAVVKAAEVVRRLATHRPVASITDSWRRFVEGMGFERDVAAMLVDPQRIWEGLERMPQDLVRTAHALTHMTVSPNVCHGGSKTNVIPDRVELEVDIRLLPGQSSDDVRALLADVLGELAADVEMQVITEDSPTVSPTAGPLWDALGRAASRVRPDASLLPTMTTGGTDARYYRERGVPAYGFGLFTDVMTVPLYQSMFHGNDERVDVGSLQMTVDLWDWLARDLLG